MKLKQLEAQGHILYALGEEVTNLPVAREKMYLDALNSFEWKITPQDHIDFLQGIIKYAHTEPDMVTYLSQTLINMTSLENSERQLFAVAAPLLLIDNEKPHKPTVEAYRLKEKLFKIDPEARRFFLLYGINLLKGTADSQNAIHILEYLSQRMVKQTEQAFILALNQLHEVASIQSKKIDNEGKP